ncbi:MAG: RNB domain-containing ribonuclease [Opitutia bacterium]
MLGDLTNLTQEREVEDKVVVKLDAWERRNLSPTGTVSEVLGPTHTPMAEYLAILRRYGLRPEFPPAVEAEAAAFGDTVRPADLAGREDFRPVPTITIDPDDAKDFDDALSVERLPDGRLRVGIHVADVSHYVRPGSALDHEAHERGNSTYLVGTVIPMLPHALSSGLCSLVEAEDRLVKTVVCEFDAEARLLRTDFANSVIRSRKRLTYKQAYAFLRGDDNAAIRALPAPPRTRPARREGRSPRSPTGSWTRSGAWSPRSGRWPRSCAPSASAAGRSTWT